MTNRPAITTAALVLIVAVVLAGCGVVDNTVNTPDAGEPNSAPSTPTAKIGDSITLDEMAITPEKVIEDVASDNQFVDADGRWVGVEVTYRNDGVDTYDDSFPTSGAALVLDDDTAVDAEIAIKPSGCEFDDLTLAPGDTRRGCLAFDVPRSAKPTRLQVTVGSDSGEWNLR